MDSIDFILNEKMEKCSSKKDRSRIQGILLRLKIDCKILSQNNTLRMYAILRHYYLTEVISKMNFDDKLLHTYVANKCISQLRKVKNKTITYV